MDLRDSKSRLILIIIGLGAALVIAVASCSGSGDDGGGLTDADGGAAETSDSKGGEGDSDQTSPGGDAEGSSEVLAEISGGDLSMAVHSAVRESGGFLTVSGTLTNRGSENFYELAWRGEERELANNGFSMAGATVTDKEEGKRHLILRDTSGRCLCTQFGSDGIDPGETVSWFAQFPAPAESTSEVDFQVADLPPATIDISQR